MKTLKDAMKILSKEFGNEQVVLVSTKAFDLTTNPKGRNHKADRSAWADKVFKMLFNEKRENIVKKSRCLGSGEYNFSYVKFGINNRNEIYGVVHGKSSFHCMYPSDVWFYDFADDKKSSIKQCFDENRLSWYTERIIIVKNVDMRDYKEAYKNEHRIKQLLQTFD